MKSTLPKQIAAFEQDVPKDHQRELCEQWADLTTMCFFAVADNELEVS